MGRPKKQLNSSLDTKDTERTRAKNHRFLFRQLVSELNNCVSPDKLSTNRCLSTALSVLSLEKFHSGKPPVGDAKSEPGRALNVAERGLSYLLSARDCFGLGFNEKGMIIYLSPNFQSTMGYKENVLGEHISKIMLRAEEIMRQVFIENKHHFTCMLHILKIGGSDFSPFHFHGKIIHGQNEGSQMYLGYGERRDTILTPPGQVFGISEVIIRPDLSFVNKRHVYIDSLLGYDVYTDNSTEHVISEDLIDKSCGSSLAKQFFETGFAQHVSRLKCIDDSLLFVLAKVFLYLDHDLTPLMITYSLPFAFSTDNQTSIDEGMRFLTSNEAWLALIPSFYYTQRDQRSSMLSAMSSRDLSVKASFSSTSSSHGLTPSPISLNPKSEKTFIPYDTSSLDPLTCTDEINRFSYSKNNTAPSDFNSLCLDSTRIPFTSDKCDALVQDSTEKPDYIPKPSSTRQSQFVPLMHKF